MEIFIANLDAGIEEELLTKLFEAFGPVSRAVLARDRETRASKGFGFVTMENDIDGQNAMDDLNGRELAGKKLAVKPSIPKEERANQNNGRVNENHKIFSDGLEENESKGMDEEDVEIINGTDYTKSITGDGLIKISFNY